MSVCVCGVCLCVCVCVHACVWVCGGGGGGGMITCEVLVRLGHGAREARGRIGCHCAESRTASKLSAILII